MRTGAPARAEDSRRWLVAKGPASLSSRRVQPDRRPLACHPETHAAASRNVVRCIRSSKAGTSCGSIRSSIVNRASRIANDSSSLPGERCPIRNSFPTETGCLPGNGNRKTGSRKRRSRPRGLSPRMRPDRVFRGADVPGPGAVPPRAGQASRKDIPAPDDSADRRASPPARRSRPPLR